MNLKLCESTARRLWKGSDVCWTLDDNYLTVNGRKVHLMPWRFNRRLSEMRSLVGENHGVQNICAYKSVRIERSDRDFKRILLEELDTCSWLTGHETSSVYAVSNSDRTLLAIAETADGIVCALDLAATLSAESLPVTRHELIGEEGIITDRAINEQVPVSAVYLFKNSEKHPESFTDMDLSMLGLIPEEIQIVDFILHILAHPDEINEWNKRYEKLEKTVECVYSSIQTGKKINTEVRA